MVVTVQSPVALLHSTNTSKQIIGSALCARAGGAATAKLATTAAASTGKEARRKFFIEPSTLFATERFPPQKELHVKRDIESICDFMASRVSSRLRP